MQVMQSDGSRWYNLERNVDNIPAIASRQLNDIFYRSDKIGGLAGRQNFE